MTPLIADEWAETMHFLPFATKYTFPVPFLSDYPVKIQVQILFDS
jgi:hypothetical protein